MALSLNMIHSAVRIVGAIPDPGMVTGERRGAIGTGFLVMVKSETLEDVRYPYVLTAHHLLWEQNRVEVQAPDPTTIHGELHPPIKIDDWRQPLDNVDLAIAPFPDLVTSDLMYQALEFERQTLQMDQLPMLGATVFYIGILTPVDRSMARAGTIGALNVTGLNHDGDYQYPAHLLDCRSYGGFSGSPCFVQVPYASLTPTTVVYQDMPTEPLGRLQYHVLFCGMFTQHLNERYHEAVSLYGVGTILPSQLIWEAMMTDENRTERLLWDEKNKKAREKNAPKLEGATAARGVVDDEFERFEDLARQLVNTPKPMPEGKGEDDQ